MGSLEATESGDIIHSVGNHLVDGTASIGVLSVIDGQLLRELGHALRIDREDSMNFMFPQLLSNGFNPRDHDDIIILGIANRMIGNAGSVSFQDAVSSELNI